MSKSTVSNYRQVGTVRSGLLISGTKDPKLGHDIEVFKKTAPSIPSKYPSKGKSRKGEKNGFGGRTHRFSSSKDDHSQPGPGYYHKSTTYVKNAATCGSVSARGFTSLISKANRFTGQTISLLNASEMPGPGSYSPLISTIPAVDVDAPPQSMFAKPTRYRDEPAPPEVDITPGPGQYNVDPKINREKLIDQKTGSSFFKDGSRRFKGQHPQVSENVTKKANNFCALLFSRCKMMMCSLLCLILNNIFPRECLVMY